MRNSKSHGMAVSLLEIALVRQQTCTVNVYTCMSRGEIGSSSMYEYMNRYYEYALDSCLSTGVQASHSALMSPVMNTVGNVKRNPCKCTA